jgi:hypothetical protein
MDYVGKHDMWARKWEFGYDKEVHFENRRNSGSSDKQFKIAFYAHGTPGGEGFGNRRFRGDAAEGLSLSRDLVREDGYRRSLRFSLRGTRDPRS